MRIRSGVAVLALLMAVLSAPASSARSLGPSIPELTGLTRFTALDTATTLVRIPQGVNFDNLRVSYEGRGRVKGFMMRRTGSYEQEGFRPVMEDATIGACTRRGCKGDEGFRFPTCYWQEKDLPGVWHLYVIADGAPVTVTFAIKGRSGESEFRVTEPVTSEIRTLRPRLEESDGHRIYSAGDFTSLERADWGLVGLWTIGDPHLATAMGECIYYGRERVPEEIAFAPGCPTADGGPMVFPDADAGRGGVIFTSSAFDNPRGLGGYYVTAATVQRYGAVAFWIDF